MEVSSLQDRVQALQLAVTDATRDAALAKRKAEAARVEADRFKAMLRGALQRGDGGKPEGSAGAGA